MTISEAIAYYEARPPKGEYVLVVEGAPLPENSDITIEQAENMVRSLIDEGVKPSEACKKIAKETDFSKSQLYARIVNN